MPSDTQLFVGKAGGSFNLYVEGSAFTPYLFL